VFDRLGITYMLVGSIASSAYGEPRLTLDIDLVADLRVSDVDPLCDSFPDAEFYVSRAAAREAVARTNQFNIIHPSSGNKIDVIVARQDEWGMSQLARRRKEWILPDLKGYAASPDDVILGKLLYYREGGSEKHLRDIVGILHVSAKEVDREYVGRWAEKLGVEDAWQTVLDRLDEA
jgi:hypothetical protein